jgi:hypothetical protein
VDNELERMFKKEAVSYFQVIFRNLKEKPGIYSVRIAGRQTEILTRDLPNKSNKKVEGKVVSVLN